MHYLRSQTRRTAAHSWDDAQGVRTTDLLAEKRVKGGVVAIKYAREDESSFREWTYYLTASPAESMEHFVSFVKKQYCPSTPSEDEMVVPFSRVHLLSGIATLEAADLKLDAYPFYFLIVFSSSFSSLLCSFSLPLLFPSFLFFFSSLMTLYK